MWRAADPSPSSSLRAIVALGLAALLVLAVPLGHLHASASPADLFVSATTAEESERPARVAPVQRHRASTAPAPILARRDATAGAPTWGASPAWSGLGAEPLIGSPQLRAPPRP